MILLKDKIKTAVAEDIIAVDVALKANLTPYLDVVKQVAGHILFAGGKRLRPLLMVLSPSGIPNRLRTGLLAKLTVEQSLHMPRWKWPS